MSRLNPATLSGAIDVLIVEQDDGTLHSTDWFFRFGKLKLPLCGEREVGLYVNWKKVDWNIVLTHIGQGLFARHSKEPESRRSNQTSPKSTSVKIHPSSQQLKELNLQEGSNELCFAVPSRRLFTTFIPKIGSILNQRRNLTLLIFVQRSQFVLKKYISVLNLEELQSALAAEVTHGHCVELEVFDLMHYQFIPLSSLDQLRYDTAAINVTKRYQVDEMKEQKTDIPTSVLKYLIKSTTEYLTSTAFFWKQDVKMVLVDFDGTITKSDILGYVYPIIGRDWLQPGVIKLMNKIHKNGYKIIYTSSRAMGQAPITHKHFHKFNQLGFHFPCGPIILSPERLLEQFYRDLITKNPNKRKLQAFRRIKTMFPTRNPFVAGFGNLNADTKLYQELGVCDDHIYQVDPKCNVLFVGKKTSMTYTEMSILVNDLFPILLDQPSNLEEETEAALGDGFDTPSLEEEGISGDNCAISLPGTPKVSCKPYPNVSTNSMPDLVILPPNKDVVELPLLIRECPP